MCVNENFHFFFRMSISPIAVVLDMDHRWWSIDDRSWVIDSVTFYLAAMGQSLPPGGSLKVVVVAAFPDRAEVIVSGDWKCASQLRKCLVEKVEIGAKNYNNFESPIGQAVSRAMCFLNKHAVAQNPGRVIVFDCSIDPTDFASQSVSLSNCGWAAVGEQSPLARIHTVSLASESPASALLALTAKTGGVNIPFSLVQSQGSMLQSLFFHLASPSECVDKLLKTRPQPASVHMGTVCVCHNRSIDKGYVCSICLGIYCSDSAGICAVCGSRIRREAKDELPISAQVFEKLFDSAVASAGIFLS